MQNKGSLIISKKRHANAFATCNCDTNVYIKFMFDTAIDDKQWTTLVDFGGNRKIEKGLMAAILLKYDKQACVCHKFVGNATMNLIFDVAMHMTRRKFHVDFSENRILKLETGHFEIKLWPVCEKK